MAISIQTSDSDKKPILGMKQWRKVVDDLQTIETAVNTNTSDVTALEADTSITTETIDSGVAVSVTKKITYIDNTTTGAGAVTLAVPDSTMIGKVKVIEMTVDGGDCTLALTNVQGQSSGTTATFGDVGDTLTLVAGSLKWNVIGESGIALA